MHIATIDITFEPLLDLPQHMESKLALLLPTYKEVFQKLIELPTTRLHDHCIPLMESSRLLKVKLYRYPQSQKE